MRHEQLDDDARTTAALYALGALDPGEAQAFAEHLAAGCRLCDAEVAAGAQVADALALAPAPGRHSSAVRARLLGEVRRLGRGPSRTGAFAFIGADEGDWIEVQPGIARKDLAAGGATRSTSYLVRMQPRAVAATHLHGMVEHCYVIEGDLVVGDRHLEAGDFHLADRGTEHAELRSERGCLLLIVEAPA